MTSNWPRKTSSNRINYLKLLNFTSKNGLLIHQGGILQGRRHDWELYVLINIEE